MRVQLSKGLDKETILKSIDQIEIVDDGDYLLIPKNNHIVLKDIYGEVCVNVIDIDYIESLKDVIFVYANGVQYESNLKLYQYSEISLSLLRISKSVVVNKYKIKTIKPTMNMKFKVLINDTWLDVNRTYYYEFKDALGL